MALAILKLTDKSPGRYAFHIDTGSSPWWELVIGEAVSTQNNAEFVDGIKMRLPLRGPEPNSLKTGREINLDPSLFSEEKRFIQLFSYQTKDKKGAAFSPVIEVVSRLRGKSERLSDLPDIRLPKNLSIMTSVQNYNSRRSFSFEETPLSAPMSFAALMPLLTNLLPLAGNLLGGLMNKGGGGGGGGTAAPTGGGGGGADLKSLLTPENIKAIADVVIQLMQQNKTAVAKSLSGTVSPVLLGMAPGVAPVLGKLLTPEAITAISSNPQKLYAALADAIVRLPDNELLAVKQELLKLRPLESTLKNPPSVYSEAKIAPALLAALPALMPLAEKALDGIQNMNKEQNRHIEAIIPKGVNMDEALKQMLQSINTYNAISALQQPTPTQPQAKSVMVNALCNTIPIVEKALSDSGFEEFREKTEAIVKKVHNDMLELQEELKEKVSKMVPQLKTHDRDETKALSLMASNSRGDNGNNIFGHPMANGYNGNAAHVKGIKLLSRVLPAAVATEYRRKKKEMRVKSFSLTEPAADVKPDPAAELLLQKIEDCKHAKASSMSMKESPAYAIEIAGSKTTDVNGVPKVVYVKEKGIAFALKLIANNGKPAPLAKAMVQVQIKNHDDTKVIVEKKFPLTNVVPGELTSPLKFDSHELNSLPGNCDLLVHISFAWKTNKNETKGVRKTHAIMVTDGYVLGRTGETIKSGIPLNNVNTHRNFWHKVWETSAGAKSKINITCRYYMHYNAAATQNAYVETKKVERRGNDSENEHEKDDLDIKMKSGMEISPVALNQLLPGLSSKPLDEQQLKALRHYEFKKQVDSAAESQLKFRHKEGDTSTLWIYPEVDLFRLTLRKAQDINALGNVLSTVDEEVVFVRPSSIHFIGTKSA